MKTIVRNCARCGTDHEITWNEFTRPCGDCTHWAMCPVTHQPILMRIVQLEELADEVD